MEHGPVHIIADQQIYGEHFLDHIEELIGALPGALRLDATVFDFSLASLAKIDEAIDKLGIEHCLEPHCFCGLITYFGEVLSRQIPARWEMRRHATGTWEPWIISAEDECPAFRAVYDRLDPDEHYFPLEWAADTQLLFLRGGGLGRQR